MEVRKGANRMKKQKLTEEQAIKECKELWAAIEESGLSKDDFLRTEEGKAYWKKDYAANCPLCEYAATVDCNCCPLITKYGKDCFSLGFRSVVRATEKFFAAVRGL